MSGNHSQHSDCKLPAEEDIKCRNDTVSVTELENDFPFACLCSGPKELRLAVTLPGSGGEFEFALRTARPGRVFLSPEMFQAAQGFGW